MVEVLTLSAGADLSAEGDRAVDVLEGGGLVVLPGHPFVVAPHEQALLDPAVLKPGSKNVSLNRDTGEVGGVVLAGEARAAMAAMTARYARFADDLIAQIAPAYAPELQPRRTSFRPGAVAERALSPRKDDRRLHVDAFPSSPVQGRRILRVFSNVDPKRRDRIWNVGEEGFEAFAARFQPRLRGRPEALRAAMAALTITRGERTAYDQAMLELHDFAKLDEAWQAQAAFRRLTFASGSSWIVYTDAVLHAALSGQHAFEQTYLMPVAAMHAPERSPLRTLERLLGRSLV